MAAHVEHVLAAKGDSFGILGVSRNAPTAEVRSAFLALARKVHPDRCKHPRATEAFQALRAAFSSCGGDGSGGGDDESKPKHSAPRMFATGTRVRLKNLVSRADLNGRAGEVTDFDSSSERCTVHVDASLSVRVEISKLEKTTATSRPAAPFSPDGAFAMVFGKMFRDGMFGGGGGRRGMFGRDSDSSNDEGSDDSGDFSRGSSMFGARRHSAGATRGDESRQCRDCGKSLVLEEGEKRFFISKGLDLPKRCKNCRRARR